MKNEYATKSFRNPKTKDELDYFPTPPWATRLFIEQGLFKCLPTRSFDRNNRYVLEPAAGGRHMSKVLMEYFDCVVEYDIKSTHDLVKECDFLTYIPIINPDRIRRRLGFGAR